MGMIYKDKWEHGKLRLPVGHGEGIDGKMVFPTRRHTMHLVDAGALGKGIVFSIGFGVRITLKFPFDTSMLQEDGLKG